LVIIISQGYNIKYEVGKNDTKLFVLENGNWTLIGTESWNVYGTTGKVLKPSVTLTTTTNKTSNITKIVRKITYTGYGKIYDTYVFDGKVQAIESIPKERYIEFNITKPFLYEYTVKGFAPTGPRAANLIEQYGRLKVILDPRFKSAIINNSILSAKYNITSNLTLFITMIDPLWNASGVITYNLPSLDPTTAYVNSTFNCSIYANFNNITNVTYTNGTNYTVDIEYFKNSIQQYNYSTLNKYNTTPVMSSGKSVNGTSILKRGDVWHCRAKYYTTSTNTSTNQSISPLYISNYVTILNSIPNISLISPLNSSVVYTNVNAYPTLVWNGSDIDNDTLRYEVYGE
jgi:hypothetical protein